MSKRKPNIAVFLWDNPGSGEVGCFGAGILRGVPTLRLDSLAAEGQRLVNLDVEAQCTPSHSALLTGRRAVGSGNQTAPITGSPHGLTRWEKTNAKLLSEPGYASRMW